ncbi:hypothetical protein DFH09DRAFT_1114125 [Mycena vulgaris]|nr:hypothetical protein DFH09DRAFT_1114125 [Mycena vulgaris]
MIKLRRPCSALSITGLSNLPLLETTPSARTSDRGARAKGELLRARWSMPDIGRRYSGRTKKQGARKGSTRFTQRPGRNAGNSGLRKRARSQAADRATEESGLHDRDHGEDILIRGVLSGPKTTLCAPAGDPRVDLKRGKAGESSPRDSQSARRRVIRQDLGVKTNKELGTAVQRGFPGSKGSMRQAAVDHCLLVFHGCVALLRVSDVFSCVPCCKRTLEPLRSAPPDVVNAHFLRCRERASAFCAPGDVVNTRTRTEGERTHRHSKPPRMPGALAIVIAYRSPSPGADANREYGEGGKREGADRAGEHARMLQVCDTITMLLLVTRGGRVWSAARAPEDIVNTATEREPGERRARTDAPGQRRDLHAAAGNTGQSRTDAPPRADAHAQAPVPVRTTQAARDGPAVGPRWASMRGQAPVLGSGHIRVDARYADAGFVATRKLRENATAARRAPTSAVAGGEGRGAPRVDDLGAGSLSGVESGVGNGQMGRRDTAPKAYCDARGRQRSASIDAACDAVRSSMDAGHPSRCVGRGGPALPVGDGAFK